MVSKMDNKKVLIINTIGLNFEGMTSVIYNYTSAMNKENLTFEFIAFQGMNEKLKKQFESLGKLLFVTKRKSNILKYCMDLITILKQKYDVVHIHGNSGTMFLEVILSKILGTKKVIIHCHNTRTNHPLINNCLKTPMIIFADKLLSCSKDSGKWLYGNKNYEVLPNAIDLKRFKFDCKSRSDLREEFNIKDNFVIGHIGHFTEQKNHVFLIDIFYEFHKKYPNSKLLLLSDGPLYETIQNKVHSLRLEKDVIFAGRRSDAYKIYNAFDVFVLPSLWEGLPLVALEAQANGLPVIMADTVTTDAICTSKVFTISLSEDTKKWVDTISSVLLEDDRENYDTLSEMTNHGFNIEKEAEKLRQMYLD